MASLLEGCPNADAVVKNMAKTTVKFFMVSKISENLIHSNTNNLPNFYIKKGMISFTLVLYNSCHITDIFSIDPGNVNSGIPRGYIECDFALIYGYILTEDTKTRYTVNRNVNR